MILDSNLTRVWYWPWLWVMTELKIPPGYVTYLDFEWQLWTQIPSICCWPWLYVTTLDSHPIKMITYWPRIWVMTLDSNPTSMTGSWPWLSATTWNSPQGWWFPDRDFWTHIPTWMLSYWPWFCACDKVGLPPHPDNQLHASVQQEDMTFVQCIHLHWHLTQKDIHTTLFLNNGACMSSLGTEEFIYNTIFLVVC